jgi:hypothetical protein
MALAKSAGENPKYVRKDDENCQVMGGQTGRP